jgi:hypothetical protein
MRALLIAVVVIGAVVLGVVKAVMRLMIQEEARTRLERLPFALIRLASARVPRELRDDLAAEWHAELEFLLTGTGGMPVTRVVRGIRYSAGLLLSAREITDELTRGDVRRAWRLMRLAIGGAAAVIGCGGIPSGIAIAGYHGYGITASIGETCMAISWVIGGITVVRGRFTGRFTACAFLLASLLGCVANVAFYMHGADVVHLIWSALYLCVPLAMVAFKLWTRGGDRLWREYQELRDAHAALYPDCAECFGDKGTAQDQA